eukprot:scaffold227902_cov35-Prasinocladus_malaysianus.AAC.1
MGAACSCDSFSRSPQIRLDVVEPKPASSARGSSCDVTKANAPEDTDTATAQGSQGTRGYSSQDTRLQVSHRHAQLHLPSIHTNSPRPNDLEDAAINLAELAKAAGPVVGLVTTPGRRLEDAVREWGTRADASSREVVTAFEAEVDSRNASGALLTIHDLKVCECFVNCLILSCTYFFIHHCGRLPVSKLCAST